MAAGPGAKGTCPGYRTDRRGALRQAAHRGGMAGASLTRPLARSRLFPLSGCRLYLQLHRKQRGRRRAERESPISRPAERGMQETQPPNHQKSLMSAWRAVPGCRGCRRSHGRARDPLTLHDRGELGTAAGRSRHGVVFSLARPRSWILSTLAEKFSIFCIAF